MKELIFNRLIGNDCPEFRNDLLDSYFFKLILGKWLFVNLFLDSHFQKHPESVILQKYHSISNQIFKHNFAPMLRMFNINGFFFYLGFLSSIHD